MTAQIKRMTSPVVPIGELRERVTIERATTVSDGMGGQTTTWATLHSNVPAMVKPVRGAEPESLDRTATQQTYLVVIRTGYAVTTEDRVVWGSSTMNIRSVENRDMRLRRDTLVCESGLGVA